MYNRITSFKKKIKGIINNKTKLLSQNKSDKIDNENDLFNENKTDIKEDYKMILINKSSLEYISKKHRTVELCKMALKMNAKNIKYIPHKHMDHEMCKNAVMRYSGAIQYIPKNKITEEICEIFIRNWPKSSYYIKCIPHQSFTPKICKMIVDYIEPDYYSNCYYSIELVPKNKRTEELYIKAIQKGYPFGKIPTSMYSNKIFEEAILINGQNIVHVPATFITEKICKLAINKGVPINYIPIYMRTNEIYDTLIINFLSHSHTLFKEIPESLRTYDLCKIAVFRKPSNLKYVPSHLKSQELYEIIVNKYPKNISIVPASNRTMKIYEIMINHSGEYIVYVPDDMKTLELCEKAIDNLPSYNSTHKYRLNDSFNCGYLEYIPFDMRTEKICKIALAKDPQNIKFVPELIKKKLNDNPDDAVFDDMYDITH